MIGRVPYLPTLPTSVHMHVHAPIDHCQRAGGRHLSVIGVPARPCQVPTL